MMLPDRNAPSAVPNNPNRTPVLPSLQLTDRDRSLITEIFLHRALTRRHVIELAFFSSVSRANARLSALVQHGLLLRIPPPVCAGSGMAIYTAGPQSVPLIAAELNMLPSDVRRNLCQDARPRLLEHCLLIADIRCAFQRACTARGYDMEWYAELETRHAYTISSPIRSEHHVFRPDGCAQITNPARSTEPVLFFLEADRANTSLKRWQEKLRSYRQYEKSGLCSKRYRVSKFDIAIVTTVPAVADRLLAIATADGYTNVYFTTCARLEAEGPFADIWSAPHSVNIPLGVS